MTKYYDCDLMIYTRVRSNPKKFKNYEKFDDQKKKNLSNEIVQLVDLAKQIAEGIFDFNEV